MLFIRIGLCAALGLAAGEIQGVTLDFGSGRPLSRTILHLRPVPGGAAQIIPRQTRTGRSGQFQFSSVPDGYYILETQREGYLPAAHGQRRPTGHGTPFEVTKDSSLFSELRVHRMGAISGTIFDENGIGIPHVNVVAYRAQLPLRIAGRGVSDDRGSYRVAGLELGKHWVRTAGHTLDDGSGLLPLFGPESREPRDALLQEVRFDNDTIEANIRPEPGKLASIAGAIVCDRGPETPVVITLSSEFSQQTANSGCGGGYSFRGLAPAFYELHAAYADGTGSAFSQRFIGSDTQQPIQLVTTSPIDFEVRDLATRALLRVPVRIFARREDLSGPGPTRELPLTRANVSSGYWEMTAAVPSGYYVASISTWSGREARRSFRAGRSADWFSIYIEPERGGERIRIALAADPGQIGGSVIADGKHAAGVPVFLWPVKEETRRMAGGPRQVLSGIDGRFRFLSLPPGDYRILATRDFREADGDVMEETRAKTITINTGQSSELEIPVWIAP